MQMFSKNFNSIIRKKDKDIESEIINSYPVYFDVRNFNYIKSDNKYIGNLIVINYEKEMEETFLERILSLEVDLQMSIYMERQETSEIVKKITYHIGNTASDIKTTNENQTDSEVMETTYYDAKYIRKMLQVASENLYYVYIYISIYADDKEKLEEYIQKVEGAAIAAGLKTRRGIFREKQVFESCMPMLRNDKTIKKIARRNVLTSGAVALYPFISNELCDENGILLGVNEINKSVVMVDRFDSEKYKNSNMFIIGTSGSGKSYYAKLMAIRNRYMNISQYIIDPEREYSKICNKLNGSIINFENGNIINVMDIREKSKEDEESFLQNKINKLNTFFSLIFPNITLEEKSILEEKIIKCYEKKGITFDDKSLYTDENNNFIKNKKFKQSCDMPTLQDLYNIVKKERKLERIAILMKPYISGSMNFLNGYTNIDLSNKFIVADIYNVEEANLPAVMFIITELFWDKIKSSRSQRKVIYLDEVWRLISSNKETASFVFKMFKTIRKYGGAVTAITQDINDFFTLENGKYGRGILNNSSIKSIFQLEENDLNLLRENLNLSDEEIYKIQVAKRGTCLLCAGQNHMIVKIESSSLENKFISTDRKDL